MIRDFLGDYDYFSDSDWLYSRDDDYFVDYSGRFRDYDYCSGFIGDLLKSWRWLDLF